MISVIVPVYNVAAYLDRCVKSIVNQTYADLEIILVDDGTQKVELGTTKTYKINISNDILT